MNNDDETHKILNLRMAAQYLLLYELSVPFGLDLNSSINVSKSATGRNVQIRIFSSLKFGC